MLNTSLPPTPRILALLVRHGRTPLNDKGILRAWEDAPLSPDGELDAYLVARKLLFYKPKMVYSSDLQRDSKTAFIIAEVNNNIPYETAFALRTADVGSLSGMKEDAVSDRVLRWYQRPYEPAPSGESFDQFALRMWKFYEPKLELARDVAAFRPSVFVTHGRNIAYLDSVYRSIPPEEARIPIPGGFAIVRSNENGMDSMEFMTETEPVQTDA
jgi:2,3-bisphosphoglycerate-dependent phosphoglycerate mutase